MRAIAVKERPDTFSSPQSVISWHQGIFVARGFAADLRCGTGDAETPLSLLELVTHPLEVVSLTALAETANLWGKDPKLFWAALTLALTTSFASVVTLLLTILVFDQFGIRVGGEVPFAMSKVTTVSLLLSAMAGGAVLGVGFSWFVERIVK